jgi:hypothetical protein
MLSYRFTNPESVVKSSAEEVGRAQCVKQMP